MLKQISPSKNELLLMVEPIGWVNDGHHSVRNPANEDLDAEGFARLRAFFRAARAEPPADP